MFVTWPRRDSESAPASSSPCSRNSVHKHTEKLLEYRVEIIKQTLPLDTFSALEFIKDNILSSLIARVVNISSLGPVQNN